MPARNRPTRGMGSHASFRFLLTAALAFGKPDADGQSPKRFTMRAYDGGLLRMPEGKVVVDLAGVKPVNQVKALLHHDAKRPVGHMERLDIGHEIAAEGVLSIPGASDEIAAAQRDGFEWEASIGCTVESFETIRAGQTVNVNGRSFAGPLLVARKTILREISFVGVGAGEHTSAALAAVAVPFKDSDMADAVKPDDTKVPPVADHGEEVKALRVELKAALDALKVREDAIQTERESIHRDQLVGSVDRICAQYGHADDELKAELKKKAAAGEIKENEIELSVLRASRGQRYVAGFQPIQGKSGGPAVNHVLEAAICLNAGWDEPQVGKHFDEKTVNAAIAAKYTGFGFRSLMVEYLKSKGHDCLGGRIDSSDIRAAMQFASQEPTREIEASFSTLSLPGITSNVARKEILMGYNSVNEAILKIAKRASTTDYKPFYMYRLNTSGLFEQIGPDGEFKSIELAEDEYISRVYPWGRKLAITEVMWRNDDAGAFGQLARLWGNVAKKTIEKQGFIALLASQSTFWTTDKVNRLASGAGSALSLDSLKTAFSYFLGMKDSQQEPIGLRPKYLLTSSLDYTTAHSIHNSTIINMAVGSGVAGVVERPVNNQFQGMFEPLYSPYLDDAAVTNANGTQWLLAADPAVTAALVAAFLDGKSVPQIKHWDAIPGMLGMQWDVSIGFGFNLHDDKASVLSPGQ